MNFLKENYNSDAADAMYGSYVKGEDVEVTRLLAQSAFTSNSVDGMRSTEISTNEQILCGYASADQILQHAKRMGSICLLTGTPYIEGVMGLSLDRSLDDMHHHPEDCLLIGTRLNDTQAAHPALKTGEALNQHCREMGIDASASNHAKMCAVFRPIIEGLIRRWPKIEAVN